MNMLLSRRPVGLLVVAAAVVAAIAFLFGSGPSTPRGAEAGAGPALARSVSCADVYQDLGNDTPLGNAHDGNDVLAANSISRLDVPSQGAGDAQITSVTYLGPDLIVGDDSDTGAGAVPGDSIPDTQPATVGCLTATTNANGGAEKNTFHPRMSFSNQYGDRPSDTVQYGTYDATNTEDPAPQGTGGANSCGDGVDNGDSGISGYTLNAVSFDNLDTDCYDFPGGGADTLVFSGCAFSESIGAWGRTDVFTKIVSSTAKSTNYGKSILTLNVAAPATTTDDNGDTQGDVATNPNECKGGLAFPGVVESTAREITTDETGLGKNSGLTADPDGAGVKDSADTFADDWDGDGCTDWDELDKQFSGDYPVSVTGPVHGTDPFNPNDCDQNLDSTISIFTTVFHNCPAPSAGRCTNNFLGAGTGAYYQCIGDATDSKTGAPRTIPLRLACYSDSPVSVINSSYMEAGGNTSCGPAPAAMCGDGRAGGSPPSATCQPSPAGQCTGPYIDIDITEYPVISSATCATSPASNCLTKSTNTWLLGGCFAGLGGALAGPNVYGDGAMDTRVGAGSFTITIKIPNTADCQNGPPFTSCVNPGVTDCIPITGTATYVELKSKKDNAGNPLLITAQKNSDRDGCTDAQELRTVQGDGGYRDPYNDYDYLNPSGDKLNRVDDILAVVNEYFDDDPSGNIDYASLTDRTAIPGANAWNLGPPNGQQRVDDILAAVKQYFHDCND